MAHVVALVGKMVVPATALLLAEWTVREAAVEVVARIARGFVRLVVLVIVQTLLELCNKYMEDNIC